MNAVPEPESDYEPRPVARLGLAAMGPGSLVMERKMLLGIRELAERLAARVASDPADLVKSS